MILIGLRNCSEDLINKNLFKFKKTHPCVLWDMIKAESCLRRGLRWKLIDKDVPWAHIYNQIIAQVENLRKIRSRQTKEGKLKGF